MEKSKIMFLTSGGCGVLGIISLIIGLNNHFNRPSRAAIELGANKGPVGIMIVLFFILIIAAIVLLVLGTKAKQQENSPKAEDSGIKVADTSAETSIKSKHNFFWKMMNYATLDKAEKRKFTKQTLLGGVVCVLLIPVIAMLSFYISNAFKDNDIKPVNGNVYSDSSSKATSSKDASSENSGNSTGNIVSFNSNSGALYTYTLKEFNDRINEKLGADLFDYSKWKKQDLQKQEKSGVEFTSYTYDVYTGETLTGMIEVCVESKSNHVLGINVGVDSSADGGNAAQMAILWCLVGCDPEIKTDASGKIMDRFLDNMNNSKYEMFCYNNSAFELYKENGMIQVSILPISDAKIKENKLAVIS